VEFKKTRSWIGKLVSVGIVVQITLVMAVPTVNANYRLLMLEVTIMGAMLGIDITRKQVQADESLLLAVVQLFSGGDDNDNGS